MFKNYSGKAFINDVLTFAAGFGAALSLRAGNYLCFAVCLIVCFLLIFYTKDR